MHGPGSHTLIQRNGDGFLLNITVRPYTSADVLDVCRLMEDLGYPTAVDDMSTRMERILSQPAHQAYVAEYSGTVIGMIGVFHRIGYTREETLIQVAVLVTDARYRGMGVGRALLQAGEQWGRARGASTGYLTSGIQRQDAHQFYRHLGYEITGYRFVKKSLSPTTD